MQGLTKNTVKLENSDSRSRRYVDFKRKKLKRIFGLKAVEAVHIGSTSVKNVKARPVIDVMIAVRDINDIAAETEALIKSGFTQKPAGFEGKVLCFEGEELNKITCVAYVVGYKSKEYWTFINFRDYLNVNTVRKKEFEDIKTALAQKFPNSPAEYEEGKRAYTERIADEARTWRIFSRSVTVTVTAPKGEALENGKQRLLNMGVADKEESDELRPHAVYILGENKPVKKFTGKTVAILFGMDDRENRREVWIVAPAGRTFFKPEIETLLENDDGGNYRYVCMFEKSCGAVVYFIKDGEPLYLLIKNRSQNMGFPKGHIEKNENEHKTALREVKEETNLAVTLDDNFREYYSYTINFCRKKQAVYFLGRAVDGKIIVPKNEILSYSVVSFKDANRLLSHNNERKVLRDAHEYIKNKLLTENGQAQKPSKAE